ncbi:hypothetical protein KW882_02345 [Vibrio parahaemolyticus]
MKKFIINEVTTKLSHITCNGYDHGLSLHTSEGELLLQDSWLDMVNDWDTSEVKRSIQNILGALMYAESGHIKKITVIADNEQYKVDVELNKEELNYTGDDVSELFEDIDDAVMFIRDFEDLIDSFIDTVASTRFNLEEIQSVVNNLPQKGNTSEDCQRVALQQAINALDREINALSPMDFFNSVTIK